MSHLVWGYLGGAVLLPLGISAFRAFMRADNERLKREAEHDRWQRIEFKHPRRR